jgi:SAM-dependent methyltransferase
VTLDRVTTYVKNEDQLMRKDVERLSEIYPPLDAAIGSDLDALGWSTKPSDLAARYAILLSPIDFSNYSKDEPLRLLDVGCGFGLLLEYLTANSLLDRVDYTGVDLLDSMLKEARRRWPRHRFDQRDVRDERYDDHEFDYSIACGLFTVKHGNTYHETRAFAQDTLKAIWPSVKLGLAFNAMSKHVDWERDDLFHWPLDDIMAFCKRDLSRHVTFRLDYGLWEAATLVRKEPLPRLSKVPVNW